MKRVMLGMTLMVTLVAESSALGIPKKIPKPMEKPALEVPKAVIPATATPLPVFTPHTEAQLNRHDSLKFAKEFAAWDALPYKYRSFEVIQIVIPNDELEAYEAKFVTAGRIGRDECLKKAAEEVNALPAPLKAVAASRCLNANDAVEPADPDAAYGESLHEYYEGKDGVNLVTYGVDAVKEKYSKINPATENPYKKGRKYDFKKNGYVIAYQRIPSSWSKKAPVAVKDKEKPEYVKGEFGNATMKGGVVCDARYLVEEAAFYDTTATVEQVGGDDPKFPKCYRLSPGSNVYAQKHSKTFGIETWRVSYYLERNGDVYQYDATTLPENVVFNQTEQKKSKSGFK